MTEETTEDGKDVVEEVFKEVDDTAVENPFLVEYGSEGETDSRLEFVREWFPTGEDHRGKTRISPTQARALTVMRHLPEIYGEELLGEDKESYKHLLESLADNIEVYQTSIGGQSRSEQKDILELAFGGHSEKKQSQEVSVLDQYMQDIQNNE